VAAGAHADIVVGDVSRLDGGATILEDDSVCSLDSGDGAIAQGGGSGEAAGQEGDVNGDGGSSGLHFDLSGADMFVGGWIDGTLLAWDFLF